MMRGGDAGFGSGNDGGSGGGGAVARVQGGNAGCPGRGSGAAGPGRASRAAFFFFSRVGQNDVTHWTARCTPQFDIKFIPEKSTNLGENCKWERRGEGKFVGKAVS